MHTYSHLDFDDRSVESLLIVVVFQCLACFSYGYGSYNYTQTTRLETCQYPDSACRLLAPCYKSKCTQKYVYHRMLSVDPCDAYRGFFIDTYKLPSACSCHLPQ